MPQPRTFLSLESLEARENPSSFTESFNSLTPPGLPSGWATWSSDGTASFTTTSNTGVGGTGALATSGGSATAALAWHPESQPADTSISASVNMTSLVPVHIFARGNNLDSPGTRSYLAAVVTRGMTVQLVEVTGTTTRVLGKVTSPGSAYYSADWARVSLVPSGSTVKVEVVRQDTGQYLNAAGTWQAAATAAITATGAAVTAPGNVGVGRDARYAGSVSVDNFTATDPTPAVIESFDTTPVGALPPGWVGWSTHTLGSFQVSTTLALSDPNGFAVDGLSTTTSRAWANTDLPRDVDVSAAIHLGTLIPVQVFARGSNIQTSAPSYYALSVTRGLDAKLLRVVNGTQTVLASIKSDDYFSGKWLRARLVAEGTRLRAQLYRADTGQWLSPDGSWADTPDFALQVQDAAIGTSGKAGVVRAAAVAGPASVDDFAARPAGAVTGPQVTLTRLEGAGNVTGEVPFRAAVQGAFVRLEFRLNNIVRAVSTTAPADWTFDSTTVLNGQYTLTVRAFDAAGNIGTAELMLTVANLDQNPLPDPSIPRHYSHIRIAQLAYSGTPINNAFEQNLLKNSVDLVVPNTAFLGSIQQAAPNTPQLIYSNVSNLYQGLLVDWLNYADRTRVSRELAFFHVTKPTAFQGASPSSQPVTWFWGAYQTVAGGAATDVTAAARGGRNFNVEFGAAGTATAIGHLEKFREMNVTLARAATSGWSGVWEYAAAVDANGNPTAWKTLTLKQDGTAGLRSSGRITFDPPKDWVPSAMASGGDRLYYVRFRVTAGTAPAGAELLTVFGRDYVNANGNHNGTIPAFDYAADKDGDGYLNDAEFAGRRAGFEARFVYESRLFYPYYGQMRFVTNPSAAAVRHWAADYHEKLLNTLPLADGIFMDNATGKVPFPGVSVLEPTGTFSEDSGALMGAVSRAIVPKWVLVNAAGGANTADAIVANSTGVFEEFLIRPMSANWAEVGHAADLVARRLNTPGNPLVVLDSSPQGGARWDARTQIGALAYYYLLADPDRTFLMFFGGDSPSTPWTQHWSPAVNVDVGKPVGDMRVFATGTDPANAALTYRLLAREYTKGLVLYKPLSYAQGKGEGTTADATATTHQLGAAYRVVNSNGTLGPAVTSVTLRNGEGVILIKA